MNDLFNLIYLKHNIIYGMFPIIDSNKGHKLTEDEPNQTKPKKLNNKRAHTGVNKMLYSHTSHLRPLPKSSGRTTHTHFTFSMSATFLFCHYYFLYISFSVRS